ncbi:transferase hexapeptide (six repeat-containing protein) [Kaistella treverensis]|uniref:Transferase hexapeptide (Six repeat-containing protein) n=1 Tax=Kaistella treverensis TaxID=631455 RepID=A0A1I3LYX0_9FLAO|nr:acyltransferase [Kaistella treverensis]SFI89938.1 transferase hexapeptide (six repeat-containing protein) [Kaistella treverensis]
MNFFERIFFKVLRKTSHNIIFHRNTAFQRHKSAKILVKGLLEINKKWSYAERFSSIFVLREDAELHVAGHFQLLSGSRIYVNKGAVLSLGSGYINTDLSLSCSERIDIGYDVAISERVIIRDSDNHQILDGKHQPTQPVKIGNHVWIGANVTILKGVTIGDGCVIAAGALVNKDIPPNSLAGGVPAKVLKSNIEWK